ncbi:hypothetical protein PR003_g5542 [Phytophthora rubi]|uniref:Uncharacterized protein n=1 Tax=Phytophthora rubi TaxID=129364 RepID=A0A6A4G4C1_9STRA|nr:hypothetical protein PR003_g5542 [Phytophthora rubi]
MERPVDLARKAFGAVRLQLIYGSVQFERGNDDKIVEVAAPVLKRKAPCAAAKKECKMHATQFFDLVSLAESSLSNV